jgi:hypothetical protein
MNEISCAVAQLTETSIKINKIIVFAFLNWFICYSIIYIFLNVKF